MYDAIVLSEVAESEPYVLYDFISNKLEVIGSYGETVEHYITIPAEWIYYLGVCKISAKDGEVSFMLIEADDDPDLYHITYAQGGKPPALMNLISRKLVNHQAAWLLFHKD